MSFTWEFINFEISLQSRENQKFFHFLRFVVNGEERQWERECVGGYKAGGESDIQIEEMEISMPGLVEFASFIPLMEW